MLNSVVFPAPFGPISDTIPYRGTSKDTSATATRPPNSLVTRSARIAASITGALPRPASPPRLPVHSPAQPRRLDHRCTPPASLAASITGALPRPASPRLSWRRGSPLHQLCVLGGDLG